MKKLMKIILIILIVFFVLIAGIFIWERIHVSFQQENGESSVAIIGGADGPTAVFVAGKLGDDSEGEDMGYTQINMDMAKTIFEVPGDYIILDVRRPDEFEQGHIPGAINVANEVIGEEEIPELPDKNQTIYVYCRSGNRSNQAAKKLVNMGYKNIIEFGGIIDWKGDVEK